ncbi:MAG: DUF3619 family protein [Cellvibrionaceae bacterium]
MNDEPLNEQQQQIKQLLDRERNHIDPAVAQQLEYSRQRALGHYKERPRWTEYFRQPLLVSAVAAALVVVVISPSQLAKRSLQSLPAGIDTPDAELVVQLDDFEQELAFYYWLEANDAPAS